MNPEQLLAHYERIAEAPDAIARLRRFVLDLAVRGKLVEQNPVDEPAAQLIGQIREERSHRISRGELRKSKALALNSDGPVFDAPSSWCWCLADDVWDFENGDRSSNYPSRDQLVSEGVPFINAGHLQGGKVSLDDMNYITHSKFESLGGGKLRRGDQLYCLRGSLGKHAHFNHDTDAAIASSLVILRPVVADCVPYLRVYLDSDIAETFLRRFDNGSAQPNLSSANLRRYEIPLPPLAEQHRIVAKVDELMALCDRLEEARKEREAARDRLTAASLARLNAPDPDPATFTTHARFALDNIPALTTRADQIKQLRQTILNLAVRGKLVKQDPSELPAKAFWKSRLGAEAEQASQEREIPFECPTGWCWTTVQQTLATHREISYGVIKLGDEPKVGGISTLRCSDVRPGLIELSGVRKVREEIEADYARTRLRGGEIVINIRGTLGGVALVPDTLAGFNVAREVAVVPIAPEISGPFMVYTMLSPFFWDYIQSNLRGIAYKGLNLGILRSLPIPFPPLAEQSRIVTKVDELMTLCDRLEASLSTGDENRQRLLEAILHEALEPAEERELELA